MHGHFAVPLPTTAPRSCAVCADPVDWRQPLHPRKGDRSASPRLYSLCLEASCRWLFNELGDLPDAEFQRHLQWRGQAWREERLRVQRVRARALGEGREEEAVFAALGRAGLKADLQLVVPSGLRTLRPLSRRRRRAYAAHLDEIIATALRLAEMAFEPSAQRPSAELAGHVSGSDGRPDSETIAPHSRLPGRLCGFCAGGCCASGGNRAYLSAATIRRVLDADPTLDAAGLRALYLQHLPTSSMRRSCVNHTPKGCSLPRALRADICNRYVCKPLAEVLGGLQDDPPVRTAVVLRRRQNQWDQGKPTLDNDIVGAAVLTETATRKFRPPGPAVEPADLPRVSGGA